MASTHAVIPSLVVNIVLPLVAATAVALRFVARNKKRQPIQADDWTIVGALVSYSPDLILSYLTKRADLLYSSRMQFDMGSSYQRQRCSMERIVS
jgi:predicted membrane-bound mannosyltransferase